MVQIKLQAFVVFVFAAAAIGRAVALPVPGRICNPVGKFPIKKPAPNRPSNVPSKPSPNRLQVQTIVASFVSKLKKKTKLESKRPDRGKYQQLQNSDDSDDHQQLLDGSNYQQLQDG